jgi:hypothetical protein
MIIVSSFVFFVAIVALFFGDWLDATFNVIGIRIATLFVAFAAFVSSSVFSLLIYMHNRTANKANDDANRRAELFREQQFASTNYSIIEFMDRMLIYEELQKYIDKYVVEKDLDFHMIDSRIDQNDILINPENYAFISIKIPFRVVEGKVVSSIFFDKLRFKRNNDSYEFIPPKGLVNNPVYILYNEQTKRNNAIINLIVYKSSQFFIPSQINMFSKIAINLEVTSLLGVRVKGVNELYFTNPEQIEGDGTNTYRINSSNFTLSEMPKVTELYASNSQ